MSPERATELVAGAKAIVVLSGAGLSTASGIPDEEPTVESVKVSVDASDPDEAKRRLEEALPGASSVEILG